MFDALAGVHIGDLPAGDVGNLTCHSPVECSHFHQLSDSDGAISVTRGQDNTDLQVPSTYAGPPVMVWSDGHGDTKIFVLSPDLKDDFADAARNGFSLPAGVKQELAMPVSVPQQLSNAGPTVRPSLAHLTLTCHAYTLAMAQGIQKGHLNTLNSDAAVNAAAVTPVGGYLLKKHLGPDGNLTVRTPHSSEKEEGDVECISSLSEPSDPAAYPPGLTTRNLQKETWTIHISSVRPSGASPRALPEQWDDSSAPHRPDNQVIDGTRAADEILCVQWDHEAEHFVKRSADAGWEYHL